MSILSMYAAQLSLAGELLVAIFLPSCLTLQRPLQQPVIVRLLLPMVSGRDDRKSTGAYATSERGNSVCVAPWTEGKHCVVTDQHACLQ